LIVSLVASVMMLRRRAVPAEASRRD